MGMYNRAQGSGGQIHHGNMGMQPTGYYQSSPLTNQRIMQHNPQAQRGMRIWLGKLKYC